MKKWRFLTNIPLYFKNGRPIRYCQLQWKTNRNLYAPQAVTPSEFCENVWCW